MIKPYLFLALSFLLYSPNISAQTIQIGINEILIDSVRFDAKSSIADYIALLGQPTRTEHSSNTIYVFDSLGIYISEKNHRVFNIGIDFKKHHTLDYSPKHKFKGKIQLMNYPGTINKHTGYPKLKRFCEKNQNQTLQLEFGNVQFNYGDFLLLFEHNFFLQKTQSFTIGFR